MKLPLKFLNILKLFIKTILIILLLLVIWNYFSDWYLSKIKKPIATYEIMIENNVDDKELIDIVSQKLINQLDTQIIIASPQRISSFSILNLFLKKVNLQLKHPNKYFFWVKKLQFNLDLINYYVRKFNAKTPYGGFILYDYNIGDYSVEKYKNYTDYLKTIYRVEIILKDINTGSNIYKISISPWVVADCNIHFTNRPYCRNFSVKNKTINLSLEEIYKQIGLDSSLSPMIDGLNFKRYCADKNSKLEQVVKSMYKHKQLPVLKHFLLNVKIDTHKNSYRDNKSIQEILNHTRCYKMIDETGLPYAIMPSHFYLTSIDENNILTRSSKFQKFIRKKFPNAYTISDEISMGGYSLTENVSERIYSNSSDMILVHGGTVKFWKRFQIQNGVKLIEKNRIITKIKRVLELKKHYGLLTISDF